MKPTAELQRPYNELPTVRAQVSKKTAAMLDNLAAPAPGGPRQATRRREAAKESKMLIETLLGIPEKIQSCETSCWKEVAARVPDGLEE